MSLLEFRNVSYWYDKAASKILNDVSIEFEQGYFYAITGPSGSGKTTFLALASALDSPRSGEILYEGNNIEKIGLSNFRNKYVSIVFQSYNLLPYMTAVQNVVTAMEITGSKVPNKKQYALEMLEKMGITADQAKQKVLTLSGGQQQRVSIARALSCDSPLIVADEATGNLDEETSAEIVKIFQDLAHVDGKCIIFVTHNNDIAKIADVQVRLSKGKVTVTKNKSSQPV